ncbi:hypothetical protein [Marinobacter sp. AN1]|uniref:hypothetical protein n=1 Tax=Marinobacter sp. AN1 TaxID=2886046 RepID=UPI00222F9676|nr:hypothetical protein [Marinobacter sp. AN1]UZD64641.1 hypothetical protein LJ360_13595 [Marinobacter sp. AN1]
MLDTIRSWVNETNLHFATSRRPCTEFKELFAGYFPESFLARSYYVEVPEVPLPPLEYVSQAGLDDLFGQSVAGLTLDDTYYLTPSAANNLRIHFHELVHVAQWQQLGYRNFISRYLEEISIYGYDQMPLERMAYDLDARFVAGGPVVDVRQTVRKLLEDNDTDVSLRSHEEIE